MPSVELARKHAIRPESLSSRRSRNRAADFMATSLLYHFKNRQILRTSIKTALVVGTVLGLINHFDGIIHLRLTSREILQILLTFLVPFGVATYPAAKHLQYLERLNILPKTSTDKPEPIDAEAGE